MQTHDLHLKYVIIDDDEIDRAIVEAEANKFSFLQKIASCSHPLQALEIINQCNPDYFLVLKCLRPGALICSGKN